MAIETFKDGMVRISDEAGIDKNGKPAHYIVHIAPVFDANGKVLYISEMSYDITRTKHMQQQLQAPVHVFSFAV